MPGRNPLDPTTAVGVFHAYTWGVHGEDTAMTCVLSTIENHVSIRRYSGRELDEKDLEKILRAAQRAPSGWNLQPYTIIVVRDQEKLRELADLVGGQEHVAEAAALLVFAVDYAKVVEAAERVELTVVPGPSNLYEALIDIGIAAGWAALAAEELGYGVCFIALYGNPCAVAEVLQLPRYTIPAVALALGRPAEKPSKRKRQPINSLVDREIYGPTVVKAEGLLSVYSDKAAKLLLHLFGPEGYYSTSNTLLVSCLQKQGFKLTPQ